jgi:glycosyltransferase involved in cell wall biosynthesis
MRKNKIAVVIPGHWSDVMGGAQYQADCIINALIKGGNHEIFYVARNYGDTFVPTGYKLIGIPKPFGRVKRGYLYLDAISVLRALKAISPEIIYQRIGCAYTGIAAYYARRHGCGMVWHISSESDVVPQKTTFTTRSISKYLDRQLLEYGIRNTDAIIAQTERQSMLLEKHYGRSATAVIRNFHPMPKEIIEKSLPRKIVWIANLKDLKQPELFVKLSQDLHNLENTEFIMVGEMQLSSDRSRLIREQIDRTKNLRYLGRRSQDEVNSLLANAHLLVSTSLWEGFPNTFIQAWMRRVPVISLNVNPDDIFHERMLGICSGSYDQMRIDVEELIQDDVLREAMGMHAQAYALEKHSEKNVEEILSMLNGMVKGKRTR